MKLTTLVNVALAVILVTGIFLITEGHNFFGGMLVGAYVGFNRQIT